MSRPLAHSRPGGAAGSTVSPRVSVVVCTRDRPSSLARAIDSVLEQTFQDFEVVVVDDGEASPPVSVSQAGASVRVVRNRGRGVGAARSTGLDEARGELVAYCDDDDVWKPEHLEALVAALSQDRQVVLVYGDSEWVDGSGARSVPYSIDYYRSLLVGSNYIFPTDVLHRAAEARAVGGFDASLGSHEEWDLWLRMSERHSFRHVPRVLAERRWSSDAVSAGDTWAERERIRQRREGASVPFRRSSWRDGRRQLIWHSIMTPRHSFGRVSREMLLALERMGVDIRMARPVDAPPAGYERFYRPPDTWGAFAFYYDWSQDFGALGGVERVINYWMWETMSVLAEHVRAINGHVRLLYVPCRENVKSFREGGVTVPIEVLHHGVDARRFPYLERPRRETFTFGTFGDLSPRKGLDVLLSAFRSEFDPDEPVRMVLKTSGETPTTVDDTRITFLSGFMDDRSLLSLLHSFDAFVMPSRGEGFGLPGLEAMSTGLPLIATNWSGPAEYLDANDTFPLRYRLVEAGGTEANNVRYAGLWAEPDELHLRQLLRTLYEHPQEARSMGRRASRRVHDHWHWRRPAQQLRDDLDRLALA